METLDSKLLVFAPLRLERAAVCRVLPGARVVRCGMGPVRARRAAAHSGPARAVAVVGLCGAVDPGLRTGDVIVASEVRGPQGTVRCATAGLVEALRAGGVERVVVGPIASSRHVVYGPRRRALASLGVLAADMESVWLAAAAGTAPFAVLRVVLDAPAGEVRRPLAALAAMPRAWLALRRAAPALALWAASVTGEGAVSAPRAAAPPGLD